MKANLVAPENIKGWRHDPGCDGSWTCKVGFRQDFALRDGEPATIKLFWADDIGYAVDVLASVHNPVSGDDDHLYDVQVESLTIENAIRLHEVLTNALVEYHRVVTA